MAGDRQATCSADSAAGVWQHIQVPDAQRPAAGAHLGDLPIDLCRVGALAVGVLHGGQLQQAHAKAVHVHQLVVLLLVQLRGHKLRGAWGQAQEQGCWVWGQMNRAACMTALHSSSTAAAAAAMDTTIVSGRTRVHPLGPSLAADSPSTCRHGGASQLAGPGARANSLHLAIMCCAQPGCSPMTLMAPV
jgi:hypothetical protein